MVFPQSFSSFKNPRREWFCLLDEEVYNLVRSGIIGGPSMLYTRYHEVGVTVLHPHDYGEKALPCQSILGYFNIKMKSNFFKQFLLIISVLMQITCMGIAWQMSSLWEVMLCVELRRGFDQNSSINTVRYMHT